MTTNDDFPAPTDERDSALDTLADIIANPADGTPDMMDIVDALDMLLSPADMIELRLRLELCPIHHTDLDTCAEDNLSECAHYRA